MTWKLSKQKKTCAILKKRVPAKTFGENLRLKWPTVCGTALWKHRTYCRWADLSKKQITDLALQLTTGVFDVNGKSTFKDEFVTAGGIDLREVNFRTMESKVIEQLYFCGEILNIDAITGGFNFQNAWTGGYIVAKFIIM